MSVIESQPFDSFAGQVLDKLATSVIVCDDAARVVWCNAAAEVLLGCSRAHLKRVNLGMLLPQVKQWLGQLVGTQGKYIPYNAVTQLCRPPNAPVPVHITISSMSGVRDLFMIEVIELDQAFEIVRQEQEEGTTDMTKVLLRNLAHEIKNPLGGIRGAAQLLELELAAGEQKEYTDVIINEADRLQSLVDRLLVPYRHQLNTQKVNIHEVLERVRAVVGAEFGPKLRIDRDYDVSVPEIIGDFEQLVQVFLNILRNAAQALQEQIHDATARIVLRTRVARQVTIRRQRHRLALSVHVIDNGPGIDEAIKEKIFYPLVTGRAEGTGLGLALVQHYVEQHGGLVEVNSIPGCTDFSLVFPFEQKV